MSKLILKNLSLIIPSKNDHLNIEKNIGFISDFLQKHIDDYELLIISNGSTVDSIKYIENIIKNLNSIRHITISDSGKGIAIKTGIFNSIYENILFMDADSSVKINEIVKFTKNGKLLSAFVIGNRKNKNSLNINSPTLRKILSSIYVKLIQYLLKFDYQDTQCGFKAIDRKIFTNCTDFISNGFSFDIELLILARLQGIKVTEIPVKYIHNNKSQVHVIKDSLKMFFEAFQIYKIYK